MSNVITVKDDIVAENWWAKY